MPPEVCWKAKRGLIRPTERISINGLSTNAIANLKIDGRLVVLLMNWFNHHFGHVNSSGQCSKPDHDLSDVVRS